MDVKADTYSSSLAVDNGGTNWSCPSCSENINSSEIDQHLELEIERLRQLRTTVEADPVENGNQRRRQPSTDDAEQRKPWTIFRKVQRNRHSRQRARKRPQRSERLCPVCNVAYPQEEIQQHADRCLRRTNSNLNGGDQVAGTSDDENEGEEYEEYEWAGQKRIRVSSLLDGGYAAIGIGQAISNRNGGQHQQDDEDEDLNVDEDDTQIYGPAQYGENDVIDVTATETSCTNDDGNVTNYMRHLITGHNPPPLDPTQQTPQNCNDVITETTTTDIPETSVKSCGDNILNMSGKTAQHYEQIIESLKDRLCQYENTAQSKLKCLICLDDYRNPAISVSCWHVHCEECWLRSLGARKLCPQCNLITTPKDLRRIFM